MAIFGEPLVCNYRLFHGQQLNLRGFRLGALIGLASVSGCASIVSDNESTTYIATSPEQARCELKGGDFTRIVDTPATLTLPAAAAPIIVECSACSAA